MKLASKIILGLTATIVVVMGLYALYLRGRHVVLFQGDLENIETRIAAMRVLVQDMWRHETPQHVREVVERIADVLEDVDVRWVNLDAKPGDPSYAELDPALREALEQGKFRVVLGTGPDGHPRRTSYIPMEAGDPHVLELVQHLRGEVSFVRSTQAALFAMTLAVVLACAAIVLLLGYVFVGRPVQMLRDRARRAGEGDFSGSLAIRQRDEMGELGREIDQMCERIAEANRRLEAETRAKLAALERMRHAERLASIGRFASGIAHELGTPLNVVAARAKMVAADLEVPAPARAHARVIGEQAARMTDMIRQLLDLSRRRSSRTGAASVVQAARATMEQIAPLAAERGVTTELQAPSSALLVRLDAGEVQQVLSNVVTNAVQASRAGGRVRVAVEERHAAPPPAHGGREGQYVRIVVEDEGEGIAPQDLLHVFEPFFTTKGPGEGTGLGLAITEGIVTDGGGWIDVTSERGRGTRVVIHLPLVAGAPAAQAGSAS